METDFGVFLSHSEPVSYLSFVPRRSIIPNCLPPNGNNLFVILVWREVIAAVRNTPFLLGLALLVFLSLTDSKFIAR